ncbi:MAG TPA: glutathione S-transferase family protein [Steroidobacteraceae bacterium]|nr:glutathione S-transferase family protein [Steroidobacteraceae bacterium]
MITPILWSYDASPFTQRALRVLGMKNLDWGWVETPMVPPKDALVALTGGYRGTPVLQLGNAVYIDSQRIAVELESRFPQPGLFGASGRGVALMMVKWADAFFRTGLTISVQLHGAQWPEAFMTDRRHLFADFDWENALRDSTHARAQFRAHAALLEAQLSDGRLFLCGNTPGLADAHAHPFVWMALAYFPEVACQLFAGFERLQAWNERVGALGEGKRTPIPPADALAIARATESAEQSWVDPNDPQALRAGERIVVAPEDTRRGEVIGELVRLDAGEIVVRRSDPACGDVFVHFPRMGYRVSRAAA